jgi:ketosteroid isomerase-like protein
MSDDRDGGDDYEQIRSLVHAYAELIDEGDFDGVADLFQHATLVAGDGSEFRGHATLRNLWAGAVRLYDGGLPNTRHVITNVNVKLAADRTTATSQSYVTVMQAVPGLPLQAVAVSIHRDTFAKVDGAWRFVERRDRQALVGDLSRHMHGVAAPDAAGSDAAGDGAEG